MSQVYELTMPKGTPMIPFASMGYAIDYVKTLVKHKTCAIQLTLVSRSGMSTQIDLVQPVMERRVVVCTISNIPDEEFNAVIVELMGTKFG